MRPGSKRCPKLVLLGLMMTGPAGAEVARYGFALTPWAGDRIGGEFSEDDTDEELELDAGASFGLILNAPFDDRTEWEVFYGRQETDIQDAPVSFDPALDIVIEYLQVGGTYVGDGERARPYLAATVGASRIDPDAAGYDSDTYFAFAIGGGLQLFAQRRMGLRLEGRLFGSLVDSDSGVFCQSGPTGSRCLIQSSSDVFWQWEMFAGLAVRF